MPVPKSTFSLDSWTSFTPQERANDCEYNLLLHKFRSLYNAVKDYQQLHSNCSVAKASSLTPINRDLTNSNPRFASPNLSLVSSTSSSSPRQQKSNNHSHDNQDAEASPQNNPKQPALASDFSRKLSYFQHQHSIPPLGTSESLRSRLNSSPFKGHPSPVLSSQHVQNHNSRQEQRFDFTSNTNHVPLHHKSSYNLSTTNSDAGGLQDRGVAEGQLAASARPEVRKRKQISNSARMLLTRSNERLDNLNNNSITQTSESLEENGDQKSASESTEKQRISGRHPPIRQISSMNNDNNIYDAVSPEDMQGSDDSGEDAPDRARHPMAKHSAQSITNDRRHVGNDIKLSSTPNNQMTSSVRSFNTNSASKKDDEYPNSFGCTGISSFSTQDHSASNMSMLSSSRAMTATLDHDDYANYVNIDFFLKRSRSPSLDGVTENDQHINDEDTSSDSTSFENDDQQDCTELASDLSRSLATNNNSYIDRTEAFKDISPREIARQLSTKTSTNTFSSNNSLTPASSDDIPHEHHHNNGDQMLLSQTQKSNTYEHNRQSGGFNKHNDQTNQSIHKKSSLQLIEENIINDKSAANSSEKHNAEVQDSMRSFLNDLNLSSVDNVLEGKSQRRIVKESFAVEFCGRRKLRHLFLFNDVIVCAKYQASSKQKFTFDVKWYLNLSGVSTIDLNDTQKLVKYDRESIENQILAIRTNLLLLRGQMQQIKRSKQKQPSKVVKKLKKKRTELEAELVLLLPHLPLVIKYNNGKKYTFFLSSNFDRNQWIESIKFLQSRLPNQNSSLLRGLPASISQSTCSLSTTGTGTNTSPSSAELQAWIQTCRKNLNPSLGTFLLRTNCDDDLLYGDLYFQMKHLEGIVSPGNYYFCFEVDSYGHFTQKASSAVLRFESANHELNEDYVFSLDGAHTLRILLYEDLGVNSKPSAISKAQIELSRAWFIDKPVDKTILFNSNLKLTASLSYSSSELLSMRIPHAKLCPSFGMDITQVCKKEKTSIPLLIQLCVNEVERRGMREVGIYRMSGTSTDIQRLKKAFETNPYVAELLLRDIDINSVTGFLKTYLREIPEGLFSNKLYLKFVAAFNIPQSEHFERAKKMIELFHQIPKVNQITIIHLVEHLINVNKFEKYNKMSLTNLATVIGPNILKAPSGSSSTTNSDPFTAVVIGSMSQAGILYFFLNRKYSGLSLTELEASELAQQ